MNFTEAVSEVVQSIKRPDLISQVRREINAAISFYCLDNEFADDYSEQVITIDAQEYTQAIAISEMTRFRKFKYIKRGGTRCYLDKISEAEMFKGCLLQDKYYIVGTNVNVSLKALAATLDVGFFSYPPLLTDAIANRDHWMLEKAPYMIIDRACAVLYRNIGDEKSMQAHMVTARESYLAARKAYGIANQ